MFTDMEKWSEIRRRVLVDGLSKRAACRAYDIHWDTLTKILEHPEPPGYRRTAPRPRPKLDPFLGVVHQILEDDKKAPSKQRHTAQRIFDRLRAITASALGSNPALAPPREIRAARLDPTGPLSDHR